MVGGFLAVGLGALAVFRAVGTMDFTGDRYRVQLYNESFNLIAEPTSLAPQLEISFQSIVRFHPNSVEKPTSSPPWKGGMERPNLLRMIAQSQEA